MTRKKPISVLLLFFYLLVLSCDPNSSIKDVKEELLGTVVYPEIVAEIGDESSFFFDENEISLSFSDIADHLEYEVTPDLPSGVLLQDGKIIISSKAKIQQRKTYAVKIKLKDTELFKESTIEGELYITINKKKISGFIEYSDLVIFRGESINALPKINVEPFFAKGET